MNNLAYTNLSRGNTKLSPMDFWFINWLMFEKEINMAQYDLLTKEDICKLHDEFIIMYQSIT